MNTDPKYISDAQIVEIVRKAPDPAERIWELSQETGRKTEEIVALLLAAEVSLAALGITKNYTFWDRKKAVELFKQGKNAAEIGREIGVNGVKVRGYLTRIGLHKPTSTNSAKQTNVKRKPALNNTPKPIRQQTQEPPVSGRPWYGDLCIRLEGLFTALRPGDTAAVIDAAETFAKGLIAQTFSGIRP